MRRLSLLVWPLLGLMVAAGFAPFALWGLTIGGLALFFWGLRRELRATPHPVRRAAGRGWLMGLGLWGLLVGWIDVLGWYVAVALVAFMALWGALVGVLVAATRDLRHWPVWAALSWTCAEWASSRVPFGGFGWMRLGYISPDTGFAGYLPWMGVAGVGMLVAWCAALLAWGLEQARGRDWRVLLRPTAVSGCVLALGHLAGLYPALPSTGTTLNVGMVQGNVDGTAGSEAMGYARSVTDNHLSETIMLMARARTGQVPMPDLVVWPENSTDIDPLVDAETHDLVTDASTLTGRPIYVGAVMQGPGPGERQTSSLWWQSAAEGATGRYDKRNLVPFGEFIPLRETLLPLLPILEQVGAQAVPGVAPSVLPVRAGGHDLRIGTIICFELAWDATVADAAPDDVNLVVVQSNNATYTGTGQPRQQFAITRVRAMEMRRDIVVATTSSFSGHIGATGEVQHRTDEATSASAVYRVALQQGSTPALRLGPWLERAGVLGVMVAAVYGLVAVCARRT